MKQLKLNRVKLVKEMARDRIGQPRTEQTLFEKQVDIRVCPDCGLKWEKCLCDGAGDD